MPRLYAYFLVCLLSFVYGSDINAQKKSKPNFSKQLKEIKSKLLGIYEMRNTDEKLPLAARVNQDLLFAPVWESDTEHWYYTAWLNPQLKDRPLEEVMLRIYQNPAQPDKILCDFHRIPNATTYQYEWKNKKPYGDLTPSMVLSESNFCAGELKILAEDCLQIITYAPCPREESNKGGSYMATVADIKVYPKYITMGNKHIDKDGATVLQLEHANFMFKKSASKPQSY